MKYINNASSDGSSFGQSATDLVSFYGATPIVKPTGTSQSAVSTATISAVSTATPIVSGYGYSTTAQAQAMQTAVNDLVTRSAANTVLLNQIRSDLVSLGLLKGSA